MTMMVMMKRSPVWVLLGLSLVVVVLGDQQDHEGHQDETIQDHTIQKQTVSTKQVSLLGGWFQRSPESEEVQAAALHAVEKFNSNSKAKKVFKLVSITSAQSQVTNVINFKLKAILGKTACLKSEANQVEKCSLGRKRLACKFEVSFNPRKQSHNIEMTSCKMISSSSTPTSSPMSPSR